MRDQSVQAWYSSVVIGVRNTLRGRRRISAIKSSGSVVMHFGVD